MADPLEALLAQAQLSDEDRRQARAMALMSAGFGLLGAPRGQEWQALGRAGLLGLHGYNDELQNLRRDKLTNLAAQNAGMELLGKKQAYESDQALREAFANLPSSTGMGLPNVPAKPVAPSVGGAAQLMYNATGTPPPAAPAATPATGSVTDIFERQMALADYFEQAAKKYPNAAPALMAKAQQTRENALKFRDENQGVETVMGPDGQPVLMQRRKYGAPIAVSGFTPKPEMDTLDLGGTRQVIDKLRLQPGQTFAKTMTPGEIASNEIARGNLGVAQGNLSLARQREGREAANAGQLVQDASGNYVRVQGGNVLPVTTASGAPLQGTTEARKKELDSIDAQLNMIGGAKQGVQATPDAFGMKRGLATLAGTLPESVAGRFDSPEQRSTRAYVFNVVSSVINERAGAAQSVQELARLRSFLPAETDNAKQITDKLGAFEAYLHDKRKTYAGQGAPSSGGARVVDFSSLPSGAK